MKPEYYSYSYSSKNLSPNIIRIRIRSKIWVRILFVFVFGYFENTNIIRCSIRPPMYRTGTNKKTNSTLTAVLKFFSFTWNHIDDNDDNKDFFKYNILLMWCVDQPVHLVKALQTTYIFESREFDQLIRWEGKWFNIDSTGPTRNSESESENEMRIQCKHQKTW